MLLKFGAENSNLRHELATLALKTTCTISNVVTVAFEISVSQNVSYCILTTQHKEEIVWQMVFKKVWPWSTRRFIWRIFFFYTLKKKQIFLSRKHMYFMTICVYQHFRVIHMYVQSAKIVCTFDKWIFCYVPYTDG